MTESPTSKAPPKPSTTEAGRLADQLERSFHGGAWHGPAFAEALAGVDAATAARRPIPGGHTVWEIVGHVSTWLELGRRRIEGHSTDEVTQEDDWPPPVVDGAERDEAWRRELTTLEERYRGLHTAVAALDDARLDDPVGGSDPTVRGLVLGMLQHHAYHGGQVVLLRKGGGTA